jgi:F-type H+-transporting ATPase subunit epsilon
MAEKEKSTFVLEVVTPEREVLSEEVSAAVVPGEDGYFGVLPSHEPFITTLMSGTLEYQQNGEKKILVIHQGFVEVLPDKVIIAAEKAERPEEIDAERAQAALGRAEKRLKEHGKDVDLDRARASLTRAAARLSVLG